MPKEKAITRARKDAKQGKSPSTQAGEFVREEIRSIRRGKHGARSPKQAIAIGLSEARRAGVKVPLKKGAKRKIQAKSRLKKKTSVNKTRSRAALKALQREPQSTVSPHALSEHAQKAAQRRSAAEREEAAMKAVRTKGNAGLVRAARRAAHAREARSAH
jgi:Family of unknown function (DUF6496)